MTRTSRPSALDLETARARVKAVTDWIAAREHETPGTARAGSRGTNDG